MSITEHPDFAVGRTAAAVEMAAVEPISDVMRRWEAERYMLRNDPVLAILLRIEAIAAHRAENHVCDASKLPAIADLAREAVEKHTKKPFRNTLFP